MPCAGDRERLIPQRRRLAVTIQHDRGDDPDTVIGLIYRVLDERKRAITLLMILLFILLGTVASIILITALGPHTPAIWWSGTGALEFGWLLRTIRRPIRRDPVGRGQPTDGQGRNPADR